MTTVFSFPFSQAASTSNPPRARKPSNEPLSQVLGIAVYVLPPELALCIASYELVRGARRRPRVATIGGIIAVPFMYLGMLATGHQFLG